MAFLSTFYLHCYVYPSDLHSFPTRRSSDLIDETLEIVKGYDAETLDVITQINTHSYNGSQLQALNTLDRKSTRLNSSHVAISYAVFCLKKKTQEASKRR